MTGISANFTAFGCRLNQAELEAIAASFRDAGFSIVRNTQKASVLVFSTCTVTGKAEQKARRVLRAAARDNPDSLILVTGCYAELDPLALTELAPGIVIIPGSEKSLLAEMARELAYILEAGLDPVSEAGNLVQRLRNSVSIDPFLFSPGDYRYKSRASLKIQDGCNNACSYCRVCIARGPSVSIDPVRAIERAQQLEAMGFSEIVLTGVNLSQYRYESTDFPGLLSLLLENTRNTAFRISSWEPDALGDGFLEVFSDKRVRPHLHLAVQSGSNTILKAMRRSYSRETVLEAVRSIRQVKDSFIGMDIICGFPGETEDDFNASLDLLLKTEPAGLHVFPFSPRPGTEAYKMKPFVPERIAGERVAILAEAVKKTRRSFAGRRIGQILEVIPEKFNSRLGTGTAISPEYLNLILDGNPSGTDRLLKCRIIDHADQNSGFDLKAEILL